MIDEQRYRSLIQQLATGGITGNNNNYMNGGGVGSMMQPRMNFAGGGMDYEPLGYRDEGIEVQDLTLPTRVRAGFRGAGGSSTDGNLERNVFSSIDAAPEIMQFPGVNTIEGSLIDGDDITSRYDVQKDFPTSQSLPSSAGITAALGSTGSNQLEGYQDMIMNPEGFPNALQNLEIFQDNRFEDLEFQPGFNFKDAPNEVSNLKELYQNRNFMDNPRTGFFDNTIMSKGNPDNSLVNKTKNALDSGIGSIMDFMGRLPTPMNAIKGFANMRNPLNPTSQNYNPALQGQIDSLTGRRGTLTSGSTTFMSPEDIAAGNFGTKSGSMIVNSSTGKKYGSGSVLSGQNVVSGFGTNDYMGQLEKELDKMKNRAMKKDLTQFQQKKQQDILNEIKIEKDRQAVVDADKVAEIRASAPAFNPNTTSGGRGSYRADRDNSRDGGYGGSSKRSADNRSSDLGFSDIRLKDNIELVGKSPSDINIYNFTYLNDPKVYQGVMAQEVPWASVKHDSGYLMVDYNKVDVDFKVIH